MNAEHEPAIDFADIITKVVQRGASDLHITAGAPPTVREKGKLIPLPGYATLTTNQTRAIVYGILNNSQRQRLEENLQLDFAYSVPRMGRFRINCYFQRGALAAAFRLIPSAIKTIEQLGLPQTLHEFVAKPRGLV
ncbi:MAG: type IV pili twitching motility protein PilT, partial [Thermoleophilia bacterium]|nr:type IV pili twitching motility protein PilT [Thermoleophilia bacterium]